MNFNATIHLLAVANTKTGVTVLLVGLILATLVLVAIVGRMK